MNSPLWKPQTSRITASNIARFSKHINTAHGTNLQFSEGACDYESLHKWSIKNKEAFWQAIWDFFQVKGSQTNKVVLKDAHKMPGCQWFPDAKLNFAENLLSTSENTTPAVITLDESGRRKQISHAELRKLTAQMANSLRALGVVKGDRVAGFLPNCIETLVAMLATTSLGAVWSSCSPDFGITGVIDRFGQIKPKVLFATNGYYYGGKTIDSCERVENIARNLPDLKHIVCVPFLANGHSPNTEHTSDFYQLIEGQSEKLQFTVMSFNDPLYIMYSSGTTGVPKCIVHSIGGTLLQHLKEHALHVDVKRGDRIFYYTTCGWMMWNWLVSALALDATLVLFDGSPFHPAPQTLFDMIDNESINIFGSSAKYFAACEKADLKPAASHNLSSLKSILSTGSPLSHESFEYVYREIKKDVCLSSISGGTDIISCFALGASVLPVYKGELQCIGLGMDVAFFDDNGAALDEGKGELVCRAPFPSMPTGFWNDGSGEKYQSAYFSSFDNIWAHGDYGEIIQHSANPQSGIPSQRGVIIHGRSDAVLNPGGVRIGTAEIYRQVEKVESVLESIAIGQEWHQDVRVILFVKMKPGAVLNDDIIQEIKQTIRLNTTPRHVPSKIIQVKDIPRTISGKIVELAVRNVVHGIEVKNKDALANPEALSYFKDLPELLS
jgi:acetoacetyl-CoA synthetase